MSWTGSATPRPAARNARTTARRSRRAAPSSPRIFSRPRPRCAPPFTRRRGDRARLRRPGGSAHDPLRQFTRDAWIALRSRRRKPSADGAGASARRRSKQRSAQSRSPRSSSLRRAISAASRNAAATPAAGSSTTRARTTAAGGARWRSAATGPSRSGSRPGGAGLRRLAAALLAGLLAGCAPALETDQARLCRMAMPALTPQDDRIAIVSQKPDADGRGLTAASPPSRLEARPNHTAVCRFKEPGRPREFRDLISLTLDGEPLSDRNSFSWSATGSRRPRAEPPTPRRLATSAARRKSAQRRLRAADGDRRPAAVGDLRASGGGLFADLRSDRTHQFRLR